MAITNQRVAEFGAIGEVGNCSEQPAHSNSMLWPDEVSVAGGSGMSEERLSRRRLLLSLPRSFSSRLRFLIEGWLAFMMVVKSIHLNLITMCIHYLRSDLDHFTTPLVPFDSAAGGSGDFDERVVGRKSTG